MKRRLIIIFVIAFSILKCGKVFAYDEYKIGDKITYRDEEYYVIENSDSNKEYITLLKSIPLTVDELYKYGRDENDHLFVNEYYVNTSDPESVVSELEDGTGGISFYTSETCGLELYWNISSYEGRNKIETGCKNDYDSSDVKRVIDNWSKKFSDDLVSIDGYRARLITINDLIMNLGYDIFSNPTQDIPEWLYNYNYWTMITKDDYIYYISDETTYTSRYRSNSLGSYSLRPVINLNKCALNDKDNNCKEKINCKNGYKYKTINVTKYKDYELGEEIYYNNEKYYILNKSGSNSNYVTVLKDLPLTYDEINDNKGNLDINVTESEDNIGLMPYYKSDTCNSSNQTVCTNDYNKSTVKTVLDNWSSKFNDDLIEVNGYKTRLINRLELIYSLGYSSFISAGTVGYRYYPDDLPLMNTHLNVGYWTMDSIEDKYYTIDVAVDKPSVNPTSYIYDSYAVRPVMNLNKCVLDGGCTVEEVQVEDKCIEENNNKLENDNKTIVNVENTLKVISTVLLIVSILLIIGGMSILGYNYIKSRKERR